MHKRLWYILHCGKVFMLKLNYQYLTPENKIIMLGSEQTDTITHSLNSPVLEFDRLHIVHLNDLKPLTHGVKVQLDTIIGQVQDQISLQRSLMKNKGEGTR